jgi:hypothetical protein
MLQVRSRLSTSEDQSNPVAMPHDVITTIAQTTPQSRASRPQVELGHDHDTDKDRIEDELSRELDEGIGNEISDVRPLTADDLSRWGAERNPKHQRTSALSVTHDQDYTEAQEGSSRETQPSQPSQRDDGQEDDGQEYVEEGHLVAAPPSLDEGVPPAAPRRRAVLGGPTVQSPEPSVPGAAVVRSLE